MKPPAERAGRRRPLNPPLAARWRRAAGGLLALVVVAVGFIVLTPGPPAPDGQSSLRRSLDRLHQLGALPDFVSFGAVEWSSNVLMFAPVGFLLAGVLPVRRRWWVVPAAATLSCGIELFQKLFLPERVASLLDVLANTLGAALGLLVLTGLSRWMMRTAPNSR